MRSILVTGSDTSIGKTHVVAALARALAERDARVQIIKAIEAGAHDLGDAERAKKNSGCEAVIAFTLASFAAPLAPAAAAAAEGRQLSLEMLVEAAHRLPLADWRIYEGAGGIATPIDEQNRDWADFAAAFDIEAVVIVVPDRLGAINQARLAYARAVQEKLRVGVCLNATGPVEAAVTASNRAGLRAAGVPIWAELGHNQQWLVLPESLLEYLKAPPSAAETLPVTDELFQRIEHALAERTQKNLRRSLRLTQHENDALNLADNDYLELARDPAVIFAASAALAAHGASASASPLITGWREPHAQLLERLCVWHGFPCGMLWTSGYAANSAVLSLLPTRGDLVLADRLIHNSMIAGLLRSGARLRRYEHLRLDQLEEFLGQTRAGGSVFVVTESVFSMDGDYPDLARMAELKRRHNFIWIVDEAHALGWFGVEGAGLVRAANVAREVDVFVGTLGKTLASGGAYTLFRNESLRDYLINSAGEFIYSTAFPPAAAAAALAALERVRELAPQQPRWHAQSRDFRAQLRREGWAVSDGDSPIVPVRLDDAEAALSLADALRGEKILTAAVRPPTVPSGTSRLRFSLKRTFGQTETRRILEVMQRWRNAR